MHLADVSEQVGPQSFLSGIVPSMPVHLPARAREHAQSGSRRRASPGVGDGESASGRAHAHLVEALRVEFRPSSVIHVVILPSFRYCLWSE